MTPIFTHATIEHGLMHEEQIVPDAASLIHLTPKQCLWIFVDGVRVKALRCNLPRADAGANMLELNCH